MPTWPRSCATSTGTRPFAERKALFRFLYIHKHNPGFDNAQWQTHADECNRMVWEEFWICLDYFLQHANELDFNGRLNKHNHTPLFPYLVALVGDRFPIGSTGLAGSIPLGWRACVRRAKRHAGLERTWAPAQRPQAGGGDPA